MTPITVTDAIRDENLLGHLPCFREVATWAAWLVFLRALYGLPMDADDLKRFEQHTGRTTPRPGGYAEAVAIVGRQAGKSQITSALAAYEGAMRPVLDPELGAVARGRHVLLIAQDFRGAQRVLLNYAREAVAGVPLLANTITRETSDTLELSSGLALSIYPCRPAAARGIRAQLVVVDELAHFISSDGRRTDREMLRAVRPCLATTGGKLLILSSPYGQSGALWDLHRQHYGRDESSTLVWQASAPEMNPTLPADYLMRMEQDDPDAYRSEVLGQFRAGVASLFDADALDACVVRGRRELEPVSGVRYSAFVDPSGGRKDAFTLAVGHRDGQRIVVDALRAWKPPFNPTSVVAEAATLLKAYRIARVTGDRYGGEWPREQFRAQGIGYVTCDKPKSDLYLELLPVFNAGTIDLPDLPELLRELRGLERRRGSSGRDRVDHAPGAHDDVANAVAGLASLLPARQRDSGISIGPIEAAPPTPWRPREAA